MQKVEGLRSVPIVERDYESPPDIILAREYYDVEDFEKQAQGLIDGRQEIEHDAWQGQQSINARTALFEELTAKGHLSRIEFDGDMDEVNRAVMRRLLNGWSDHWPKWELERRFYEIVEELIVQQAGRDIQVGILPKDTIIGTNSNFPESADDNYAWRIGYRSLNRKGMVRTTHFEQNNSGEWVRVVEQISRSNSNDGSSGILLGTRGDSLTVLSNQFITTRSQCPDGVVGIQRALDSIAGPHIRYGEDYRIVSNLPTYEDLRGVSYAREAQAKDYIKRLADFEVQIDVEYKQGRISYDQKLSMMYEEREKIVNEICLLSPSYAKDARGDLSAVYYEKAAIAMASGNDTMAQHHLSSAMRSADPRASAVCGGIGHSKAEQEQAVAQVYASAKAARENWKWTTGLCIVKKCPTRPAKTEVGPCEVCRGCQSLFDKGLESGDINKHYEKKRQPHNEQVDFLGAIAMSLQVIDKQIAEKRAAAKILKEEELAKKQREQQRLPHAA